MCERSKGAGVVAMVGWLLLYASAVAAQGPASIFPPIGIAFPLVADIKPDDRAPLVINIDDGVGGSASAQNAGAALVDVRRITLQQAQQLAATASNPLERLGELQVEAARQHRLGVKSLYFPNVSTQFINLHFNDPLGQVLTVRRPPIIGEPVGVPVNVFQQDWTVVNVLAAQPITALFSVRQLVKIARADENVARAKAGLPVTELAGRVENNYFDLLIAQRELLGAGADAKRIQAARSVAAVTAGVVRVSDQQTESIAAEKSLVLAASRVKELTTSLNELLGLPEGTRLELVPPDTVVENLTLRDVTAKATAASADLVEAEMTAVKARAGSRLAKMEYIPGVAVLGGYIHQTPISYIPQNNWYLGFEATYTLFNGGKRERGVKEADLQAEAAGLGVELTRAKTASNVKSSFYELERSRELYQLARRMVSAGRAIEANYVSDGHDADAAHATLEAELFRAELQYRQAYTRVKTLMGEK
jgi:outer membrane protein TolC